ncbi:MAG: hypothetical protein WDN26_01625 [Chitinophagaceae bacterium]
MSENKNDNQQQNDIPGKTGKNAGSGGFNQGSEDDLNYDDGTPISDEEKRTGKPADPGREKENPKDGNIGKNNAGGYK